MKFPEANKKPEPYTKSEEELKNDRLFQMLLVGGSLMIFKNQKKDNNTKTLPVEEPARSEKEIKIRKYITENNITDEYLYFNEERNYLRFNHHHNISLKQLKEIAEILEVEDIIYKSEADSYEGDYDPYTIIEWDASDE